MEEQILIAPGSLACSWLKALTKAKAAGKTLAAAPLRMELEI